MVAAMNNNDEIIALRDERGSYNIVSEQYIPISIIALRDERGSYNRNDFRPSTYKIIALRDERGSYNTKRLLTPKQ